MLTIAEHSSLWIKHFEFIMYLNKIRNVKTHGK